MKIKHIAAAAIAAIGASSFAPAYAGIDATNNAELFLVVFDSSVGSYTLDTGIKLPAFLGPSGQANTPASCFSFSVGPAYAQYLALNPTGLKWALLAADSEGSGDPLDFGILSTSATSSAPSYGTSGDLQTNTGNLSLFTGTVSQTGTHTAPVAVNGESFNAKGTAAYYDDSILTPAGTFTANALGTSSKLYFATNPSFDSSELPRITTLGATVAFNGSTVTVTAIPEPETYALLLAGLGVVGFMARRRRAA